MLPRKLKIRNERPDPDDEVRAVAQWLKERTSFLKRGEKQITFRQLRRILGHFGFELDNPDGNFIDVVKCEEKKDILGRSREVRQRVGSIGYAGERQVIDLGAIKYIRKLCRLREEDGVPSDVFYEQGEIMDTFVNQHRKILFKLANK